MLARGRFVPSGGGAEEGLSAMLEDRDYMRSPGSGPAYVRRREPWSAVWVLILINVVVWILQLFLNFKSPSGETQGLTDWLVLSAADLRQGQVWRFLTCMFAHDPGSGMHILMNMFGLWMFGRPVEEYLGRRHMYGLFLVSGLVGSLCWIAANFGSPAAVLGASGAVFGVLMACAMLYPHMKVLVFFVIPLKMRTFVFCYALLEAWSEFGQYAHLGGSLGANIAHLAHLGGLLGGFLYVVYYRRSLDAGPQRLFHRLRGLFRGRRPRPSVLHLDGRKAGPGHAPAGFAPGEDPLSQIDPILDKIGKQGMASLTSHERALLDHARERLRKDL